MTLSPPIRFGVMGCANIARRSVVPALQSLPDFHLVGFASRTPEKGREIAAHVGSEFIGDYANLLARDDVDAIYMPLPTGLHAEWAAKALAAGKHLLAEKSLASSLAEAETLVAAARRHGRTLMENYMFQFHAQQDVVRRIVRETLGEIRLFRAAFCFPPLPPGNFRYDRTLGGGALLDAGGYTLKACQAFVPGQLRVQSACLNEDGRGVDVWGGAMLVAETGGSRIPLHVAFGFDQFYQCSVEFVGQRGKLSTSRTFTAGEGFVPSALLETQSGRQEIQLPSDNHFARLLEEFARRIRSRDNDPGHEEILRQADLQDQVRQLAEQSRKRTP